MSSYWDSPESKWFAAASILVLSLGIAVALLAR